MTIQECYSALEGDYQEVLGRLYSEALVTCPTSPSNCWTAPCGLAITTRPSVPPTP